MGYKILEWAIVATKSLGTFKGISIAVMSAMVMISVNRNHLLKNNIHDSTPAKTYMEMNREILSRPGKCDIYIKSRSPDGSCNNLSNPAMGMNGIRFGRNVPHEKTWIDHKGQELDPHNNRMLLEPNPRDVSRELLTRKEFKPATIINLAAAAWLQFMTHDWFNHGDNQNRSDTILTEIPLGADDPLRGILTNKLIIYKSQNDDSYGKGGPEVVFHKGERQVRIKNSFRNNVTHWWDGSQIYGSDEATQRRLRGLDKDGSPIIGQNKRPGNLIVTKEGRIPLGSDQVADTGFNDNWWLGLGLFHQLFVMEHNYVAKVLRANYKETDKAVIDRLASEYAHLPLNERYDQYIFDKARLIVSAEIAKIHTVEWTPAILKNPALEFGMMANWSGLSNAFENVDDAATYDSRKLGRNPNGLYADPAIYGPGAPTGRQENLEDLNAGSQFSGKFLRLLSKSEAKDKVDVTGDGNLGYDFFAMDLGLVGIRTMLYKVPFTLTEEFTSVYRMHSLVPDSIQLKRVGGSAFQTLSLEDTRNEKVDKILAKNKFADLWYSFGTQYPGALTLNNFPKILQNLTVPYRKFPFIRAVDMGTIDLVRDRERGVPRYNEFRRSINMPAVERFEDFFIDARAPNKPLTAEQKEQVEKMRKLYGDVEKVDLLIGSLAESIRPEGFGFGETAFQIFVLMASRRLMTDRFFSESYTEDVYTPVGIQWVNDASLKAILERHVPELSPYISGLENGNAFKPWRN